MLKNFNMYARYVDYPTASTLIFYEMISAYAKRQGSAKPISVMSDYFGMDKGDGLTALMKKREQLLNFIEKYLRQGDAGGLADVLKTLHDKHGVGDPRENEKITIDPETAAEINNLEFSLKEELSKIFLSETVINRIYEDMIEASSNVKGVTPSSDADGDMASFDPCI